MLRRDLKLEFVLLMIILILIPSSLETRAKASLSLPQEEFDPTQLLPSSTFHTAQTLSNSLEQQQEVLRYLTDNWNINEVLGDDLISAVETICQAVIALASIPTSSDFEDQIFADFDLILSAQLYNSRETLNVTSEGLFYTWNKIDRNVSTTMNLWIASALLTLDNTRYPTSIETANTLMQALNLSVRGKTPAAYFRKSILLDPAESPLPGSISPITLLQDQLMAMIIFQRLSYRIFDEAQIQELLNSISHLENMIMSIMEGFLDFNLSYNMGLDFGFFHSERDQIAGEYNYPNNCSTFHFKNGIFLLDYFFQQIQDYSSEGDREVVDHFDLIRAQLYQDRLIHLLTDIQVLFRYEDILYYNGVYTFNYTTTWLVSLSDRIYISEQFTFINLLSRMAEWFSLATSSDESQISSTQLQKIVISLWNYLTEEAYKYVTIGGQAANNEDTSSASGYFFAFYSVSLGLYLFDNTSQGSLIKANILALNGLGSIFPFRLFIEYNNPMILRDEQSLFIQIVPETNGTNSSGLYINTQLVLIVPLESINTIIANPTLSVQSNYSTRYNFTVSTGGLIKFSIHLLHKQVSLFTLEASFSVLRSLTMDVRVNPAKPTQEDQIRIYLEIRDDVGLLRTNVQYYAIIQSDTWKEPLWINKSLYTPKGENPIILNSEQTRSDLHCFLLAYKDGFYPAETNITIHLQTKLNFLVEWLGWLFLESDMGAWLGTIAAITALVWGLHARIINHLLRRVKTCHYCGGSWKTKYPVCAHCGRVLKPDKLQEKISHSEE